MIGIPQRPSGEPLESPFLEKPQPVGSAGAAQLPEGSASVESADGAHASVPLQNLLTKVARVGAKTPFVYAPVRAERKTPRRNFETTPAAEGPAVAPFRQSGAIREAARDCPRSAQRLHNIFSIKCFGVISNHATSPRNLTRHLERFEAYLVPPSGEPALAISHDLSRRAGQDRRSSRKHIADRRRRAWSPRRTFKGWK